MSFHVICWLSWIVILIEMRKHIPKSAEWVGEFGVQGLGVEVSLPYILSDLKTNWQN